VIGFLGLLAGPFMVILTGHGGGLAERIALYPLIIWLIVFGYAILAKKVRARDESEWIQKRDTPAVFAAPASGQGR
jgi:hypothetical protein